jgi:hypothetical protein
MSDINLSLQPIWGQTFELSKTVKKMPRGKVNFSPKPSEWEFITINTFCDKKNKVKVDNLAFHK